MILQVFNHIGDTMSISTAYDRLIALNVASSPYAKNKAAGSLGGAINGGTLIRRGHMYIRIK